MGANVARRQPALSSSPILPLTPHPQSPHSEPQSPTSPFMRRGARDALFHSHASSTAASDLSNRKLAHNQTELSKQIAELRGVVEAQGQIIARLVAALEGKGKARAQDVGFT